MLDSSNVMLRPRMRAAVPAWRGVVLALCAFGVSAACGGSGSPALRSTPADLNASNVATFAAFANVAAIAGTTARVGRVLDVTATPGTLQDLGCVGLGGGPVTFVIAPASGGNVTGSATYSNFDQCFGVRLNGTANVTGTLKGTTEVVALNLTTTGSTFTRTATGDVFHASGTLMLSWKPSVQGSSDYVIAIDATVSDSNQNPLFRLDNFQIDSDVAAGVENVLISGRLTTVDGFVDVASNARLELPAPSTGLGPGSLTMSGATQVATVNYTSNGAAIATIVSKP
jgi:hypothetical protein